MTIETYCPHCKATISTLIILAGQLHFGNILELDIKDDDMICIDCGQGDVHLRIIGGTAKTGNMRNIQNQEELQS